MDIFKLLAEAKIWLFGRKILYHLVIWKKFRGGENIYPAEIEATLVKHPNIVDAHVIGVESKRLGEEVLIYSLIWYGTSTHF